MELGDIEQAQKHFQMVLEMPAPEQLRALAKNGLRMDAVFYLLDAMRLFHGRPLEEIREIAFEIGMLGQQGLDINDLKSNNILRSLPGKDVMVYLAQQYERPEKVPVLLCGLSLHTQLGRTFIDSFDPTATLATPLRMVALE
jgi:hypothetical protein